VEREQPDLRLHGREDISRDVLAHAGDASRPQWRSWTFITSHAQVLLAVAHDPELRVAEIAEAARITERSAYRILSDLVEAGYLRRTRVGRRNRYELARDLLLGDPLVEEDTATCSRSSELSCRSGSQGEPHKRDKPVTRQSTGTSCEVTLRQHANENRCDSVSVRRRA
jgi:DNA-binding MarR family transcriptional regulator